MLVTEQQFRVGLAGLGSQGVPSTAHGGILSSRRLSPYS